MPFWGWRSWSGWESSRASVRKSSSTSPNTGSATRRYCTSMPFLFVEWLILFTTQVLLIRFHRFPVHRKLGFVMAGWAVAMTIVGPATAWYMDRLEFGTPDGDKVGSIQYGDIVIFAPLTAAAILCRRWPSAHKRLMLLGTRTSSAWTLVLRVLPADPLIHRLGFHFPATMVALYGLRRADCGSRARRPGLLHATSASGLDCRDYVGFCRSDPGRRIVDGTRLEADRYPPARPLMHRNT